MTHLEVDLHCRQVGLVTVAATNDDAGINALGIEIDLRPAAARLLAMRLLTAADAALDADPSTTSTALEQVAGALLRDGHVASRPVIEPPPAEPIS